MLKVHSIQPTFYENDKAILQQVDLELVLVDAQETVIEVKELGLQHSQGPVLLKQAFDICSQLHM